jgi:nitrous oxidase accessory protein
VLAPGVHRGGLRVPAATRLRGETGAIVDGGGTGTVITVAGDGASVEDLVVRGSGRDVMKLDSGVQVLTSARVRIRGVVARDVLYGISAERAGDLEIAGCTLTGRVRPGDETGSGNGIHLWYCTGGSMRGNRVDRFLDAIYLSFTHGLAVEANHLAWNGRYGLHTMYCQENRLARNTFTFNVAGCALMFSNRLVVEGNDFVRNRGPRTYGLLLRDCSDGTFTGNRMADNTVAVFLDGSNRNRFRGNLVENNGWGLLLFASCRGNEFAGNNFIANDYPVALDMRRTDNRFDDGREGNYWSENAAYDLDDDGVADEPFGPVSAFAFVSKQYPDLTILARSPAVAALGVAERLFPSLSPSEAVDRFPRVRPARIVAPDLPAGEALPARNVHGAVGAGYAALLGLGLVGVVGTGRGWGG